MNVSVCAVQHARHDYRLDDAEDFLREARAVVDRVHGVEFARECVVPSRITEGRLRTPGEEWANARAGGRFNDPWVRSCGGGESLIVASGSE